MSAAPSGPAPVVRPQGNRYYDKIEISGHARAHVGDVISFELPENATQEIHNLNDVIHKAETACRKLHQLLATDENAVEQLVDIAHEPQAIYQILGTIKASLANRDTSDSVLWAAGSDNTQASLETCYATITEISQRIGNLNIQKPDPKAVEPTVMSREEIGRYRQVLISQKISLNMAISMTCLYQSQITREVFNTMKEQMAILLERLENEKAERLPKAPPHYDIDRSVIPADLGWSTKRYLADAASMFTEAVQRNDPSIQVSSYFGQQSMATTFWTCHSNMAVGRDYAQIFVTGLPIPNMDKLVVDVDLGDTVAEIRDSILQRLSLVHADFGLMYGNKILTDTTATMKEYNVERNSSLRCVSFRPNRLAPGHWVKTYDLIILTSDRLCVTLQLISGVEYPVPQIKEIFLTEYRRVKKHNFNVNGTIHVTLLSQKKGLILDNKMVIGYRQQTDIIPPARLIAWIFKSREQSDRFSYKFSLLEFSAQCEFLSKLPTVIEHDIEDESFQEPLGQFELGPSSFPLKAMSLLMNEHMSQQQSVSSPSFPSGIGRKRNRFRQRTRQLFGL